MARSHWRIDSEHPDGYLVPFTPEEEAQADRDEAAETARETADTAAAGNEHTLRDRLEQALANWPALTGAQKDAVLKALVRLAIRRLDSTG